MPVDRAQTVRGALAGAVAAGVYAASEPIDRRFFGVDYEDAALLGKLVTRGPAWRPVGVALHLFNGAAFGAAYANVAPSLPLPSWARGPACALAEGVASWPLTALVRQLHPAADEFPPLFTNPRAIAAAAWRHALFGIVLGELERRLNAPADSDVPSYEDVASSNGHGDLEAALAGSTPSR
jgi:hypothetical protein